MVCRGEFRFIQIQCDRFKEPNGLAVGDRVVPIQFSKPHLSYRRVAKVVSIYLPATYEISSKVEL